MSNRDYKQKTPGSQNKVNSGLALIVEHYKEPTVKLIKHLRSQGYSLQKIADIIGVSKQAVHQVWLDRGAK